MSERYSRLFALPENLYAEGSPVVIAAGALLKDNQTGKVLAQLKFKSISQKMIKAIRVKITPLDTVLSPLGEEVEYPYLDLHAYRNSEFGQKTPIALPDATTRGFSVAVHEVVFADNTIWQSNGEPWETLKRAVPLHEAVPDSELRHQVQMEYGSTFNYMPTRDRDLWMCSCGEWNRSGETACCHCNQELSRLLSMDMEDLKAGRNARLSEEAAQAELARAAAEVKAKKAKKLAAIILPIAAVVIVAAVLISGNMKKKAAYEEAMAWTANGWYLQAVDVLEEAGYKNAADLVYGPLYEEAAKLMASEDYEAAKAAFEKLDGYSDSNAQAEKAAAKIQEAADRAEQARLQGLYEEAEALLAQGDAAHAAMAFYAIAGYQDARERSFALWDQIISGNDTISGGAFHEVAVKADGTVVANVRDNKFNQGDVSDWDNIVAISAETDRTIGLKSDGTVLAVGENRHSDCDVDGWDNIVQISTGAYHTVGLKSDGTVVTTGYNTSGCRDVSDWNNIVKVSAEGYHTVGLKEDRTVLAVGSNKNGECDVSDWTDIAAISAGWGYTVGLKADGTVLAVGSDDNGQCDVSDWTDIVAIAAGEQRAFGLKADGTVVMTGHSKYFSVSDWKDIKAISAWGTLAAGLKADGTVVGYAPDWTDIKLP